MRKRIEFRKHFDYDVVQASNEAADIGDYGESLTVQEHALDADINELMRRFKVTGQMPQGIMVPEYGDFTGIGDYRSALHAVMDAQENFMRLPAEVRARFQNDPQLFLDFAENPANIDSMREMGLAPRKEVSNGQAHKDAGGAVGASGSGAGGDKGAA